MHINTGCDPGQVNLLFKTLVSTLDKAGKIALFHRLPLNVIQDTGSAELTPSCPEML